LSLRRTTDSEISSGFPAHARQCLASNSASGVISSIGRCAGCRPKPVVLRRAVRPCQRAICPTSRRRVIRHGSCPGDPAATAT